MNEQKPDDLAPPPADAESWHVYQRSKNVFFSAKRDRLLENLQGKQKISRRAFRQQCDVIINEEFIQSRVLKIFQGFFIKFFGHFFLISLEAKTHFE